MVRLGPRPDPEGGEVDADFRHLGPSTGDVGRRGSRKKSPILMSTGALLQFKRTFRKLTT